MTIKIDDPGDSDTGDAPGTTWYADTDGDGYGDPDWPMTSSNNPGVGRTLNADDCDDSNSAIYPGATEHCDGMDNNCDSLVDEAGSEGEATWYADHDGDGYGDPDTSEAACDAPDGTVPDATDCDDNDPQIHPGAEEFGGDGLDSDCNGSGDVSAVALLFSETLADTIWRMKPDGSDATVVSTAIHGPHALAVDTTTDTLYTSQWDGGDEIHRMSLDGTNVGVVYAGSSGGQGIAIDPGRGLLFWGEYYHGLWVGSMDGLSTASLLVSSAQLAPANGVGIGVQLDPPNEQVYFFTHDNSSAAGRAIWRVNYDGSGLERLYDLESATCMCLESVEGFLYFSDYRSGKFQMWRSDLDGSNAEYLFDNAEQSACSGVAVDPTTQLIYYQASPGSAGPGTIWRSDIHGANPELLRSGVDGGQYMVLLYE